MSYHKHVNLSHISYHNIFHIYHLLEKVIVKEIEIDKIDESCSALLLSTDSMLRGLHNSSIYSLYTGQEIVNHGNRDKFKSTNNFLKSPKILVV